MGAGRGFWGESIYGKGVGRGEKRTEKPTRTSAEGGNLWLGSRKKGGRGGSAGKSPQNRGANMMIRKKFNCKPTPGRGEKKTHPNPSEEGDFGGEISTHKGGNSQLRDHGKKKTPGSGQKHLKVRRKKEGGYLWGRGKLPLFLGGNAGQSLVGEPERGDFVLHARKGEKNRSLRGGYRKRQKKGVPLGHKATHIRYLRRAAS